MHRLGHPTKLRGRVSKPTFRPNGSGDRGRLFRNGGGAPQPMGKGGRGGSERIYKRWKQKAVLSSGSFANYILWLESIIARIGQAVPAQKGQTWLGSEKQPFGIL